MLITGRKLNATSRGIIAMSRIINLKCAYGLNVWICIWSMPYRGHYTHTYTHTDTYAEHILFATWLSSWHKSFIGLSWLTIQWPDNSEQLSSWSCKRQFTSPLLTATLIHIQRQSHWQLAAPWGGTPLVVRLLQFAAMLHASLVLRFYCNIAL